MSFSSRLAFDAPIRFPDGREYHVADWSLAAAPRFDDWKTRAQRPPTPGLHIEAEVARVDRAHHNPRYPSWGDSFLFILHFPGVAPDDDEIAARALVFARLWVCRHLRENPQPRSHSRTLVTIEGTFRE